MQAEHRNPVQRDLKYNVDGGPDAGRISLLEFAAPADGIAGRPFLDQGKEAFTLG